jgi:hypothetical protein
VRASTLLWLMLLVLIAGCERKPWAPTPLADGYQIMIMNSEEVYIADGRNELILGPEIEAIGIAPGTIVVDCGLKDVVVNQFANTVGFNVIDTRTGVIWKRLTAAGAAEKLRALGSPMPEMRPLSSYLQ